MNLFYGDFYPHLIQNSSNFLNVPYMQVNYLCWGLEDGVKA